MGSNKRKSPRIPAPMEIEVRIEGCETLLLKTSDISNGGAFIQANPQQCPAIGSVISLKVKGPLGGEEPPTVPARVVRVTNEGIGVEFLPG